MCWPKIPPSATALSLRQYLELNVQLNLVNRRVEIYGDALQPKWTGRVIKYVCKIFIFESVARKVYDRPLVFHRRGFAVARIWKQPNDI